MDAVELRDLADARRFVLQSLNLQRVANPSAAMVRPALEWALLVAASGQPLPPVGCVADLAHLLIASETEFHPRRRASDAAALPGGVARAYEDFVLGHWFTDLSLSRASDVIRRLEPRDQGRGLVFVLEQFRERSPFGGVLLSPAVIKSLLDMAAEDVLVRAGESLRATGLMPIIPDLYADLIAATRRIGDVLGPEDLFELEHGTALAGLSQRLALRQVLALSAEMESGLLDRLRPRSRPREVPTAVRDDDTYPVGGFVSLATRGAIESLLHSQLAFMETDPNSRPDLFDVKFLRDELLYYSRDENQFWRRRQSFAFVFMPDLVFARFKDPELPAQRIIHGLAWVVAAVRSLERWLSSDAISFELWFQANDDTALLGQERALLEMLLRDAIALGTVTVRTVADLSGFAAQWGAQGLTPGRHAVIVGTASAEPAGHNLSRLLIAGRPQLLLENRRGEFLDGTPVEAWRESLDMQLREWIT